MAAATPSEPHAIVRSLRSRTDEHPASLTSSKATAHTKACATQRRANMEQGSTQSDIMHAEEVLAGDKAAAPGVLRPAECTFRQPTDEVVGEHPPAPYLRAHLRRSTALPAQGRATRQSEQRERVLLNRKRQQTRSPAVPRSPRRAPTDHVGGLCAQSRASSRRAAGFSALPAWGRYFSLHPEPGCGALRRAAMRLLRPASRVKIRAKTGSLLVPSMLTR